MKISSLNYDDIRQGDKVVHPKWSRPATVVEVGDTLVVKFDTGDKLYRYPRRLVLKNGLFARVNSDGYESINSRGDVYIGDLVKLHDEEVGEVKDINMAGIYCQKACVSWDTIKNIKIKKDRTKVNDPKGLCVGDTIWTSPTQRYVIEKVDENKVYFENKGCLRNACLFMKASEKPMLSPFDENWQPTNMSKDEFVDKLRAVKTDHEILISMIKDDYLSLRKFDKRLAEEMLTETIAALSACRVVDRKPFVPRGMDFSPIVR